MKTNQPNDPTNSAAEMRILDDHTYALVLFTKVWSRCTPQKLSDQIQRSYKQATESVFAREWAQAIKNKFKSLQKMCMWGVIERDSNQNLVPTKWVFTVKKKNGTEEAKARLVAIGNEKNDVNDYGPLYSPFCLIEIHCFILSLATIKKYTLWVLDITTAYLNSPIETDVYLCVPMGMDINESRHMLKLKRAIYGLRISAKCWYNRLLTKLKSANYRPSIYEPCLLYHQHGKRIFATIYVDDILVAAEDEETAQEFVNILEEDFTVKVSLSVSDFLRLQIEKTENGLQIFQRDYIEQM